MVTFAGPPAAAGILRVGCDNGRPVSGVTAGLRRTRPRDGATVQPRRGGLGAAWSGDSESGAIQVTDSPRHCKLPDLDFTPCALGNAAGFGAPKVRHGIAQGTAP